ncbi:MAG: NAD(P)/FAD-dependent oxidoreductase [Gammaproteobacteria bacterium]|nr:NAD(P)/FAD-dependent oxidoreductase [Gammaproteobacteria bacterium]
MSNTKKAYDVIVLGAGAAGMMCAWQAGLRGRSVLLLEVSNKIGKKILMSGGGRCNFTNLDVSAEHFICDNPHFVKSALSQYTPTDFIALVEAHEIAYHEKAHGQLFCDQSAKQIVAMLTGLCDAAGVTTKLNVEVQEVAQQDGSYRLSSQQGNVSCRSLVVACGGLSIPTLGGATGMGYHLARQFGLAVNETEASLVPFTLSGHWHEFASALSGVALPVSVSVPAKAFHENMLFTHRGLSGPAILQLSNYWYLGEPISINLLPEERLPDSLIKQKRVAPNTTLAAFLQGKLPKSLAGAILQHWWPDSGSKPLQQWTDQALTKAAAHLSDWEITPSGTEGYRTAEVTRGGVDVAGISSKTMEANAQPGLYFIGEVLDVTGHLGGYNFQWAWSSGYAAGQRV